MIRIRLNVSSKLTLMSFILEKRKKGRGGGELPRPRKEM